MFAYDSARKSILEAGSNLSARQYAETIAAFNRDGPSNMPNKQLNTQPLSNGISLAIIGGPMIKQDLEIFDIVEQSGGNIVLDATETSERGMCATFDRRGLCDNPLMELSRAYFGSIPDASRRPNSELYNWLKQKLADRAVRGIIFRRYLWCDTWHAELGRLKDWAGLPVLDIDVGGDSRTQHIRTPNRIRAFLEMLQ
jgi:benzoyl-CoA reductase/2-hydroxyglutaryl-CoA dehydratase subunit BcrC/BadD/HgdB